MQHRDDPQSYELLLGLVGTLQEEHERERAALAQQLHGEMGGLLAAVRMSLGSLQREVAIDGLDEIAASLAELERQAVQALDIKQRLVEQLRPGLLDHFGLGVALPALAEAACRDAGARLLVHVARDLPALPVMASIALYRLGEAALTRILRALPHSVDLELAARDGCWSLLLRHDGGEEGFESAPEIAGFDIWLSRLGGGIALQRTPPAGCCLVATLPLGMAAGARTP